MSQEQKTIAILGHRGIPSRYGGFETFAEKITPLLVKKGFKVVNYCRRNDSAKKLKNYLGSSLVYLPTVKTKSLDTLVHTFLSVIHLIIHPADSVIMVNVGNSPFAWIPRIFGMRVVLNVDGLEWNRKKWGSLAKLYFKVCAYLATFTANEIVTDGKAIQDYYWSKFGKASTMIPYGGEIERKIDHQVLKKYGLEPNKYFLYVSRFEPENNPLLVRQSYERVKTDLPLVMVGDAPYAAQYVKKVKETKDKRIIFLGYVYGQDYKALQQNAYAYIRASEVNGSSPALIEAMGYGNCVLYNDVRENLDVVGECGLAYSLNQESLIKTIEYALKNRSQVLALGKSATLRVEKNYSWLVIASDYLKILFPAKKEKILITGCGGMLGRDVYHAFKNEYQVMATDVDVNESWLKYLDVTDKNKFEKAVYNFRPDYIFHLAAETDLEKCEKEKNHAFLTNALSVETASFLAAKYSSTLVYISTANVFPGLKKEGYKESDEADPINYYAKTKYLGELAVKNYLQKYYIVRAAWMIGGGPLKEKKFIRKIIEQISGGCDSLKALKAEGSSITYTKDLAQCLFKLIKLKNYGLYHCVNSGYATRFDLARQTLKVLGYTAKIKLSIADKSAFKTAYFAQRPAFERLLNTELIKLGIEPKNSWQKALNDYLRKDYTAYRRLRVRFSRKIEKIMEYFSKSRVL